MKDNFCGGGEVEETVRKEEEEEEEGEKRKISSAFHGGRDEEPVEDLFAAAVRGFNGTVFVYGQTNNGKTHTMRGSQSEPGIIPLAVNDLFENVYQGRKKERKSLVLFQRKVEKLW
ncbi:Kinesin-like protein [Raphanus sativus]|nr:Kinesin-like protein [Raphanus sativus]